MADIIDAYLAHLRAIRAEATVDTYGDILHRLDRVLPWGLASAHTEELGEAINTPSRSPASRKLMRAAAAEFYRWAIAEGELDWDPTLYLPTIQVRRGVPRPISHDQLADILTRARVPFRIWFLLAAGCGLRCVEIAGLDREHVDPERTWVHGKGGRQRLVPTHPAVWRAVKDLPPGPIARTPNGRARADRREVMDRGNHHLQRTLGHHGVTMHRLRHTFATAVYRSHGEFVAQQLLGHASPSTTAVYAQVASEAMIAAVTALPLTVDEGDGAGQ